MFREFWGEGVVALPPLVVSRANPFALQSIEDALRVPMPPRAQRQIMVEPGRYPGFWAPPGVNAVVTAAGGPGSVVLDAVGEWATVKIAGEVTLRGLTIGNSRGAAALWCAGGSGLAERCSFGSTGAGSVYATRDATTGRPGKLALRGCHVRQAGVVYEDATGVVEDCEIGDVSGAGVALARSVLAVRRCRILRTGGDGLRVLDGSRLTLEHSSIADTGGNGLLQGDSEATITDVRMERPDAGVHFGRGLIMARNLSVEDAVTVAVYCDADAVGTFADSAVRRSGKVGVYAGSGRGVTFTGGVVEGCGSEETPAAGVYAHEGARLTLQGTAIRANTAGGVVVAPGVGEMTARGCEISGNRLGVVNTELPGVVLEGNSVHDNPGGDRVASTQG